MWIMSRMTAAAAAAWVLHGPIERAQPGMGVGFPSGLKEIQAKQGQHG